MQAPSEFGERMMVIGRKRSGSESLSNVLTQHCVTLLLIGYSFEVVTQGFVAFLNSITLKHTSA